MEQAIRLVASDIDGTLLRGGAADIPPVIFDHIRRLEKRGVLFCPASGRQYHSLRRLFAPVADRVPFLCENGAVIYGPGTPGPVWSKTAMPRPQAEALCRDIMALPGVEVLISGANTSYLCPKGREIEGHMRWVVGNNTVLLPGPERVPEDIIKVAAFCPGILEQTQQALGRRWEGQFQVAVAGKEWLDFTLADKGTGLEQLCRTLGVALSQVMAFGDNFNDVPMLRRVGRPYIVDTADPRLCQAFPTCADVAQVLERL